MKAKHLVEHTNDWSIDSKRSMVDHGYFDDDYIHYFSKKKRRSPLINMCYYVRATVIDKVLRHYMINANTAYQVISLGAGFDTTFFRLFSNELLVKYVEIDLPCVIKKKIDIILNTNKMIDLLHNVKGDANFLVSDHYIIFAQNLAYTDELDTQLKFYGIDFTIPTILLSEVAITYMEDTSCTQLCRYLAEKFINGTLILYEQINILDGFGRFMMNHFDTIQSPLKALTRYNQDSHHCHYYVENGWQYCDMVSVMDLYNCIASLDEFAAKIKLEPFDEWEEFHLTCLHYGLYFASNGSMRDIFHSLIGKKSEETFPVEKQIFWSLDELNMDVARFSHSLMPINDYLFILIGGIGVENNYHRKTSTIEIINLVNKQISLSDDRFNQIALTHMASCVIDTVDSPGRFFIHGGCKSPARPLDLMTHLIDYEPPSNFRLHQVLINDDNPKPCHRWRHSALSYGNNIFIFGGRTCSLEVLDDFWMLELAYDASGWSGKWNRLEKGPRERFSHSCVSDTDSGILISGGLDSHLKPLSDLWRWSCSEGWLQIDISMSVPRYGHTSCLLKDKLILVGGITLHPSNPGISVVDLINKYATHFTLPVASPEQPIMLHNHQSYLSQDKRLLTIIGGGGNCFSFGTSFNKHIVNIPLDQLLT